MSAYNTAKKSLKEKPRTWLITGVAGFIGSNLLEALLNLDQQVIGLDNFETGSRTNLEDVQSSVDSEKWGKFVFVEGDIRDLDTCKKVSRGIEFVLHQAALGSVPRSIDNPLLVHGTNVNGFLNMLLAARENSVSRFIYATSSSVYGDHPSLPRIENTIGNALSPYAVTKLTNELYAKVFGKCYGLQTIGLRYFNVFGPRQNPDGAYAAVIPKWILAMMSGSECVIYGDGETSRDFCYVENVVQANILAVTCDKPEAVGELFNVAVNDSTNLNSLFELIRDNLAEHFEHLNQCKAGYRPFRNGDVRHSDANISKASRLLGYTPSHTLGQGLRPTLDWYRNTFVIPGRFGIGAINHKLSESHD